MGYKNFRRDYLQSYYKGVNNLSPEAKKSFEQSLHDSEVTANTDPDLLNEQFKTWILVNELSTTSDSKLKTITLDDEKFNDVFSSSDKRDKFFAQLAMTKDLDGISNTVDNPQLGKKLGNIIHASWLYGRAVDEYEFSSMELEYAEDVVDAAKEFHSTLSIANSNSIRNQAREDIQNKIKFHKREVFEGYTNMPSYSRQKFRDNIKNISQILSPDNFGYRLNGQATNEQLDELAMQYMLLQEYGGDEMANEFISNYWKDYVANRQTTGEKWANMGAQVVNNAVGTIAMVAGVVGGLVGLNGSETDWSKGILDNPTTRWANNLISTGVYSSDEQARLKFLGVNEDAILNTVQQDKELLHGNTIYELVGQYGFTAASMALSLGLSSGITKGTTWLAGKATKAPIISAIKTGGRIAQMTVPFTVGIGEAGVEVLSAKEESLRTGQKQIEDFINKTINDQITQFVEANPQDAERLFLEYPELNKYWNVFGEIRLNTKNKELGSIDTYKIYSDGDKQMMAELLRNNPEYRQKYEKDFESYKQKALEQLQESQENRMWTTFFANLAVTGSLNSTLQITQMAPGIRKAMPLRRKLHTRLVDFVATNPNQWKALAKNFSIKTLVKDKIKEGFGEGIQEYGQSMLQAYDEGKAENYVMQYLQRSLASGKPLDAFTEDFWMMVGAGLDRVGQKALSKESFKEGLYGTLSTILGGPTVNVNMNFGKRKAGESLVSTISRNMPITLGGMGDLVFAKSQVEARNKAAQEQADAINVFFTDEKNTNLFFNAVAGLDITRAYNLALDHEDERVARNNKLDLFLNAASMVEALKGTDFHNTIMETLNERANLQEENLGNENSKEAAAIEEYRNNTGDTQSSDAEVIQQLRDSAQTLKDVIKQAKYETSNIRTIFGQDISLNMQNALVSNRLHIKDAEKRINQLQTELNQVNYTSNNRATISSTAEHRSPHSTSIKRGYAKYGTLSQAQQSRTKLQEEIKQIENQIAVLNQTKEQASELEKGFVRYYSNQLNKVVEEKKTQRQNLTEYIKELQKLDSNDAENIVLSALDISELDSESRHALLSAPKEQIEVDEVQEDGKIERKKILNPKNRTLSGRQLEEISNYRERGTATFANFDAMVEDLYLLEKDLSSYKTTEEYFLKNTEDLSRIAAYYNQEARKKLAAKKYEYLEEDNVAQSFKEFRDKIFETREKAESKEELDIINEIATSNEKYGKQLEAVDDKYEYLIKNIKRTSVFQNASKEIQQNVLAIFDILNRHQVSLDLKTSSSLVIGEELENISIEEIEENWKRKTKQNYSMSNYKDAVTTATQAFDQAKSDLKAEEEIYKSSHVDEVIPEKNTPQRSEKPIVEEPVIENVTQSPTVVVSLDELVLKAATGPMKDFYEKHKVFDNLIRLISQGKLTTYNTGKRQATQVFFTVERIGNSHEIIQLVEDSEGTYTIDNEKYSVIGIETAAASFTSEEKSSKNVGKILERTASVVKIESKRKTGEATNLKDVEDSKTVLSNLTIGQRSNSRYQEKEMLYNTRTGRGGTVYTSSVDDARIDQVVLSEGQTAIDILHSFVSLDEAERAAVAYQYLKRLDYSLGNRMYNQIVSALATQKWDSTDFSNTMNIVNNELKSFYVLGRVGKQAYTFSLERNGDEWQMSLNHPLLPDNKYVVTKTMSPTQVDGKVIADMLLSTLAQASVDSTGKPNLLNNKPFLRFEIGLEDLKVINDPLTTTKNNGMALKKAKEGQMHRRIALGILQLPNNDSVIHPKKIQLAFNSDGKTNSLSQVTPTPNADLTDSRSNTVETTDGTIVDGTTGIIVETPAGESKVTDIFEQASDDINGEAAAPKSTATEDITSENTAVQEEEEEMVPADDVRSAMQQDDEFGVLYSRDHAEEKLTDRDKKFIRKALTGIDRQKYLNQAEDPGLFEDMMRPLLDVTEEDMPILYAMLWQKGGLIREGKYDLSKHDAELYLDFLKEIAYSIYNNPWYISSAPIVQEKAITIDEYKDLYNAYNTDSNHAKLFNLVYETAKQLAIEYKIGHPGALFSGQEKEDDDIRALGYYTAYKGKFGFLKIMSSYLNSPFFSDQDKADTLLHELIHAVTTKAIRFVEGDLTIEGVVPSKTLVSAIQKLTTIYNELKQSGKLDGQYAMTNSKELIAELSNHNFLHKVHKAQSLWKRFIDVVHSILANMWEIVTGKKIAVKSVTSKELRQILSTLMQESLKIGSLTGAKTIEHLDRRTKENQKRQKVDALQMSPTALIESWDRLTDQAHERFEKKGITQSVWEVMSSEERQKAIECI